MSVRCPQGHENPDGSAFCDECGEPLPPPTPVATMAPPVAPPSSTITCPTCGSANPAGESFCSNCGANLGTASAARPPAPQPVPASPVPVSPPPLAPAAAAPAQVVVESDNASFDLAVILANKKEQEALIGREDAVSNIFPDIDLTPHNGEDGGVGRRHALIRYSGGQYMIEDLNSINFTFVNKQKIAPRTPTALRDGDEIRLGRVVLRFKTA